MDADDISLPHRLQVQHDFLEKHLDVGLLGSAFKFFNDNKAGRVKHQPITNSQILATFVCQNPMAHPTVILRSHNIESIKYHDDFPQYEDYELWVRLINSCKMKNLNDVLLYYRRHDNNITNTYNYNLERDICTFKKILILYAEKLNFFFTEDELKVLSVITSKVRSRAYSFNDYEYLEDTIKNILFKIPLNTEGKEYLRILLDLHLLKYILFNKNYSLLSRFLGDSKKVFALSRILKMHFSGN
jgi:hypothetical protein